MNGASEISPLSDPDMSGQVSVEEASLLFAAGGVPRNPRTIRRYCQRGSLVCTRIDTTNNQEQYLIDRISLDKRIAELWQIYSGVQGVRTEPDMAGPSRSRPDSASQASTLNTELLDLLKTQVAEKDRQISVKDHQIGSLTKAIDAMIDRDRETNILIKGLHDKLLTHGTSSQVEKMITPLENSNM